MGSLPDHLNSLHFCSFSVTFLLSSSFYMGILIPSPYHPLVVIPLMTSALIGHYADIETFVQFTMWCTCRVLLLVSCVALYLHSSLLMCTLSYIACTSEHLMVQGWGDHWHRDGVAMHCLEEGSDPVLVHLHCQLV